MFCKKIVLKNFVKFTGKHRCQSLFFNKVAGLVPATLLKKRLWHRCFPVNFCKILSTPFLTYRTRLVAASETPLWKWYIQVKDFLRNQFSLFYLRVYFQKSLFILGTCCSTFKMLLMTLRKESFYRTNKLFHSKRGLNLKFKLL